jgi:hypothetical protein
LREGCGRAALSTVTLLEFLTSSAATEIIPTGLGTHDGIEKPRLLELERHALSSNIRREVAMKSREVSFIRDLVDVVR